MKICIVGTGYVGLVTAACLADVGNEVIGIDNNHDKIERLQRGEVPIYEPQLAALVTTNCQKGRLQFSTDLRDGLATAELCFICVDTPAASDGRADLGQVRAVAEEIGQVVERPLIVVTKSTVPVGTTALVKEIICSALAQREKPATWVRVASNPEFLKEGDAVDDCMKPYRVIVGVDSDAVAAQLHRLYLPFLREQERFLTMDIASAELAKYACNGMLASRISFMNELARVAEKVGANIEHVREAMGRDPRIGPDFLFAGLGYGGSCFPKDVKALLQLAEEIGQPVAVLAAVDAANDGQREWFWRKIEGVFERQLHGRPIAVWGGAFKANTDDIRYSPALWLVDQLVSAGARVTLYDPIAMERIRARYGDRIAYAQDLYASIRGVDAVIVATEWGEFRSPDFTQLIRAMRSPILFDGRNLYNPDEMRAIGFRYFGVGMPHRGKE